MAIDFGRMIQGVATGAMGQYNAEVAAKDKMKGEIIQRAGLNFYENTLPEFEKKEKSRKETYDQLVGRFDVDVAEYMGQNGFITGDANDYKNILIQLGDNPEIKAYIQVRDLTKNDNDEVYVFNGWMFSSSPSIAPFDHPVYDIWLIDCY